MNAVLFTKLLHVLAVGLFAGALLTMMMVQSLVLRATDDADRRSLARTARLLGRVLVAPLGRTAFAAGLVLMFLAYSGNGFGKVMACTPVYVHIMLGFGIISIGLAEAWKGRTRKFADALEQGTSFADARPHLHKATIFSIVSLVAALAAFYVAFAKVPAKVSARCVAPVEQVAE